MKKIYTLIVALFFVTKVFAQPCPDSLYLTSQAQVDSFQVLYPNCTEIDGDVVIDGGDITNLNGLSILTLIGGDLQIGVLYSNNPNLINLAGLDNVTSVGGHLDIYNNDALTSLTGLDNMTFVGGRLLISSNDALSSLTGLDNVTSVGGTLWISENDALTSLTGLDNINADSIEDLYIDENQLLSSCAILSICNYLANPNGTISIYNNATGCDSPEEVQDSCEANGVNIDEQFIADKLVIYPNPSSTQITLELPTTPQKNTILTIYNLNGQQLITQPITEPQTVVDINGLPSGVYFVKVVDDEKLMMGKVVKE